VTRHAALGGGGMVLLAYALSAVAQSPNLLPDSTPVATAVQTAQDSYRLGSEDRLLIRALNADEISEKPVRVDMSGFIHLPMIGRVQAAGRTVEELEDELESRLEVYVKEPQVALLVTEFRSQPVSVIGAVNHPGVVQLEGRKTLIEVLSLAGGLDPSAGQRLRITRKLEYGAIPLPSAGNDSTGQFSVADVELRSVMEARNPRENISIKPFDVISVPRAELIYVIGQVKKAGGFVLRDRETLSVLQALSLAEGLERTSAPQHAKILRQAPGSPQRVEIAVNVKRILAGKAEDVALQAQDILFIPTSAAKNAAFRAADAAIQIGTGIAIWQR
jgi:polysaccharide biosynthesis/export protein